MKPEDGAPHAPSSGANTTPPDLTQAFTPPAPSPGVSTAPQNPSSPSENPVSVDALLRDPARRRQLEAELAGRGATPEEIYRILNPEAAAAADAEKAKKRHSAGSMEGLAAELLSAKAEAQARAVEQVSLGLPDFRDSSPQEIRQAEGLLREASMFRRREKFRDAEAKCREALNYAPKDAAALELLGDLMQGVGKINEALAAYKRAQKADPKRSSAERKYADLLMLQQSWNRLDPEAVPKNGYVAVMLSLLLPGAGQIYNGEYGKGVFFLLATTFCVFLLAWSPWGFPAEHGRHHLTISFMICVVISAAVYIVALIDANVVGKAGGRRGPTGWEI